MYFIAAHKTYIYIALIVVAIALFGVRFHHDTSGMNDTSMLELRNSQQSYETTLRILDDPQTQSYTTRLIGKDLGIDHRVVVKSTQNSQQQLASVKVGDEIRVTGYLDELDFYQKYRNREHIIGIFHVENFILHSINTSAMDEVIASVRERVKIGCSRLSSEQQGICEGLIIGERGSISRETYQSFRDAQLTHLLVASGANIALMLSFLQPLLSRFRITTRNFVTIGVAVFYCMLVRFEPSMIRAAVMIIIPSIVEMRGYKVSKLAVFGTTIAACSILDPFLLFRVGFWLSVSAVFGLLFVAPYFKTLLKSSILSDTLGASLMTQPVLWLVFGFIMPGKWWSSVPGVALAGPLTTIGCVIVVSVSFLSPESWISLGASTILGAGMQALLTVAQVGAIPWTAVIGILMLVMLVIAYTRNKKSKINDLKESKLDVEKKRYIYRR